MVFTLIIMVIILLVLTPVGIVVDKKIEAYFENKRESAVGIKVMFGKKTAIRKSGKEKSKDFYAKKR